jgi:hypothetical protein
MKKSKIAIGLLLVGLVGLGWFSYAPFLLGYWAGIYPLAVLYSHLLSLIAGLILLAVLSLWPWMVGAAVLCGLCWLLTRRRGYRWALVGALFLPLMTLILLPAALMTCVPGPSVRIEPWGETYRTVYSAFATDDNYGHGLVLRCNLSGILCSQIYQFPSSVGTLSHAVMTYEPALDYLTVTDEANHVLYRLQKPS